MLSMLRQRSDKSSCTYILLQTGCANFMVHPVTASQLPITEVAFHHKIALKFTSPFSPQKGNEEQASVCGQAQASSTALVVRYAFGVQAGRVVRAHVSLSSFPPDKHLLRRSTNRSEEHTS